MTVSRRTTAHDEASPYLKITLADWRTPTCARVHGWVVATRSRMARTTCSPE